MVDGCDLRIIKCILIFLYYLMDLHELVLMSFTEIGVE